MSVFLYFDIDKRESAYRLVKKYVKDGFKITKELINCIELKK